MSKKMVTQDQIDKLNQFNRDFDGLHSESTQAPLAKLR